jgi:hypothetical protein
MFLASIPALAAALSNVDLDTEVVKILLPEVVPPLNTDLRNFFVTFPDGGTMSFNGYVTELSQRIGAGEWLTAEMTIVPSGEIVSTPATKKKPRTKETTVHFNGESLGDIATIEMPTMTRNTFDVTTADGDEEFMIGGLRRVGSMSLELNLNEDIDVVKLFKRG